MEDGWWMLSRKFPKSFQVIPREQSVNSVNSSSHLHWSQPWRHGWSWHSGRSVEDHRIPQVHSLSMYHLQLSHVVIHFISFQSIYPYTVCNTFYVSMERSDWVAVPSFCNSTFGWFAQPRPHNQRGREGCATPVEDKTWVIAPLKSKGVNGVMVSRDILELS